MAISRKQFEANSDAFADELLALLDKHQLRDLDSKLSLNTGSFRLEIKKGFCTPPCKMESVTKQDPKTGKPIKVFECVCP